VLYGIKGPGARYPDKDIGGMKAAIYVAPTYLDSVRLGLARTFWYSWSTKTDPLGITMNTGYPRATAIQTAHDGLTGAVVDCRNRHVQICRINRGGVLSLVAWTSSGDSGAFTVPYYATRMCDVRNRCQAVTAGAHMRIGRMPLWFG
jgi:hypothetical protein